MVKNGFRTEKNGWIYLSIKGTPNERGYAHGRLVIKEVNDIFRVLKFFFMKEFGYGIEYFTEVVAELYGPKIMENYPEIYEEIQGLVDGLNAAGGNYSMSDLIMWNCFISIGYMTGSLEKLIANHPKLREKYKKGADETEDSVVATHSGEGGGGSNDRCTGFMAVGSYTKDGTIVCAHNSFDNFITGQYYNVILDLKPNKGNRMIMQTCAGWIWSGTDYYVTSSGLICTETTIGGFNKFELRDPICCRIRQAMQYSSTLDDVLKYLTTNNGGDYANSWLVGDTNTNTIMRIELGLKYVNVEKKTDGYFIGFNGPFDDRLRNLECSNTGHYDVRRHQGARRVRLTELMEQHKGKIDVAVGQDILGDHYDVYLKRINPSSRSCCSHYELDDRAYMSDPSRPKPFQPRGAVDGIVCDTTMAKNMSFSCRWGSSCGLAFDKEEYFKKNIIWDEYAPYVKDRPSQPWTEFTITNVRTAATGRNLTKKKMNNIKKLKSKKQRLTTL